MVNASFIKYQYEHEVMKHKEMQQFYVILPSNSIIKDQLRYMKQRDYPAVDASIISTEDLRECKFKMFVSAEMARQKLFRDILRDRSSPPN